MPVPRARRVPRGAGLLDRWFVRLAWAAAFGLTLVAVSTLSYLVVRAFAEGPVRVWPSVASWLCASAGLGAVSSLGGALVALPGALWTNSDRIRAWVAMCASLPLALPAFLLLRTLGPGFHGAWAVVAALAWGSVAPLWLRFHRALSLGGLPQWREAALALGVPESRILSTVALPAARRAIGAGWLRSVARTSGETMVILLVGVGPQGDPRTLGAALVLFLPRGLASGEGSAPLLQGAVGLAFWCMLLQALAHRLERVVRAEAHP